MRKLFALLLVLGLVGFSTNLITAQTDSTGQNGTEATTQPAVEEEQPAPATTTAAPAENSTGFQMLKEKFIQGSWGFMLPILITLIIGLALAIERIITLNIASVNTEKLLMRVDDRLKSGDVNGAMEVCRSTQGPTASVLFEGLKNTTHGPDAVEKAIVSYGSVQMGLLEKGLVWISLIIALAPMLGFFGTVIGMVEAFDNIERVGDISPTIVAGGIKVALLTTVFGLLVAMIMQVLYNYIVAKIDSITNKMEEASVALVDMLVENNIFNR
ncbi:MAG: MotA/TolQ/ExbB proton channel family protein [Lewinellaceae bacterium]|nr:MotA/TolQ/ExbB proton channel family protein [Saprospiraceae bacterium]MCB9341188.1 MotA/TolQ/ExbB proton channel family protein [Lewinellaceae bacterium]